MTPKLTPLDFLSEHQTQISNYPNNSSTWLCNRHLMGEVDQGKGVKYVVTERILAMHGEHTMQCNTHTHTYTYMYTYI